MRLIRLLAICIAAGAFHVTAAAAELTCGNTNDCASSFNTQIAAAAASGMRLHLAAGRYQIRTPIVLPSNQSTYIFGDINDQGQRSTRIVNLGTGATFSYQGTQASDSTIHLSAMLLDGNAGSAGTAISVIGVNGVELEDLWIQNHGGHGIYLQNNYRGVVARNTIYGQKGHGVYLQDCNAIKVIENGIEGNGQNATNNYAGIFIDGAGLANSTSYTHLIMGNTIEGNGIAPNRGFGIGITNAAAVNVLANHFESNGAMSVWTGPNVVSLNFTGNFVLSAPVYLGTVAAPGKTLSGSVTGNTFQGSNAGIIYATSAAPSILIGGNAYVDGALPQYLSSMLGERTQLWATSAPTWAPPSTPPNVLGQVIWNSSPSVGACAFWMYTPTKWACGSLLQ